MISDGYLVEYSKIFNDEPNDLSFYLEGMGIDRMVDFCSHFLSLDPFDREIINYKVLIDRWFSPENISFQHYVDSKIQNLPPVLRKNPQIINHYCIYQLFEYSIQNLPSTTLSSNLDSEIQLFKTILILNERYNNREGVIQKSLVGVEESLNFPSLCLTHFLCSFDLVHFDIRNVGFSQFVKTYYLLSFLESHSENTRFLLTRFLQNQKISDWKDYVRSYMNIVKGIISPERKGYLTLNLVEDDKLKETLSFFQRIVVDDTFRMDDVDFIQFRTKPVFKLNDKSYRVVSLLFTLEKMYQGLYFELNRINKENKKNNLPHVSEDFRGFYCSKFSEEYLFYKIIERTFPKNYIRFSGVDLKNKGIKGEPDYYIRNQNKIFLFESKDVLINKEIKQSNDFTKIEQTLREKFYSIDSSDRPVGIFQILRNIGKILNNEVKYDDVNSSMIVYPILITYHNVFNTPGMNYIVNKWFKDELLKYEKEGRDISNIHNLVIIDIYILIVYHELFNTETLQLDKLIENYENITRWNESGWSFDMMSPFSMYISNIIDKKGYGRSLGLFREIGMTLVIE